MLDDSNIAHMVHSQVEHTYINPFKSICVLKSCKFDNEIIATLCVDKVHKMDLGK